MRPPAVLVVEDEPLLMMEAVDIVQEAGFRTYEATDATRAVELLETHSDIVLVFTDIDLAGSIDGLQLARTVRERWPPVKLLVASGIVAAREQDLPSASLFLAKPYQARQVHEMMRQLLEATQ